MLELDSVDAFYGESQALYGVTFDVETDETVALLGRNGAGKTSTIKSIMNIDVTIEGSIDLAGEPVAGSEPHELFDRGVSWIPQERRVFPTMTVEENLRLGSKTAKPEQREEVFDLFPRLEDRIQQRAGTLSGGEQQMLAVARGLLSDPDLLLLDEPFEGLMPSLVTDLQVVVQRLSDTTEMSILMTSQNTETLLDIVDRAVVIQNGQIEYEGMAADLRSDEALQKRFLGVRR
jgi:branched-chain amino acid transport system ATP-binding protein